MAFPTLKIVEVEQAGDALTVVFNDGRTAIYSASMLDSELDGIECAVRNEPLRAKRVWAAKRPGSVRLAAKVERTKRPRSEAHPLRSWGAA